MPGDGPKAAVASAQVPSAKESGGVPTPTGSHAAGSTGPPLVQSRKRGAVERQAMAAPASPGPSHAVLAMPGVLKLIVVAKAPRLPPETQMMSPAPHSGQGQPVPLIAAQAVVQSVSGIPNCPELLLLCRATSMPTQTGASADAVASPLHICFVRQCPKSRQSLQSKARLGSTENPWSQAQPRRHTSSSSEMQAPISGAQAYQAVKTARSAVDAWFPIVRKPSLSRRPLLEMVRYFRESCPAQFQLQELIRSPNRTKPSTEGMWVQCYLSRRQRCPARASKLLAWNRSDSESSHARR